MFCFGCRKKSSRGMETYDAGLHEDNGLPSLADSEAQKTLNFTSHRSETRSQQLRCSHRAGIK